MVPEPQSVKAPAEYVVLMKSDAVEGDSTERFEAVGRYVARDGNVAIKAASEKCHSPTGSFVLVAIPSRSFQPVKVTPKTVTTLTLEVAS